MKTVQLPLNNTYNFDVFFPQRMMKEISKYTKVSPKDRMARLRKFNERLRNTTESKRIFQEWNVELDHDLVKIPGRILPYAQLIFGESRQYVLTLHSSHITYVFHFGDIFK